MIKLLEKVSIIGLVGMGGIGKTTLSKKIYHLIYKQYDKCSYLEDVKSKDLRDVQKQLLRDLCDKDKDVNDDDLNNIKRFTTLKKVLVVIDDVGTTKYLVALHDLIINGEKKENKSKIIVTCRNWQILENHVNEAGKVDVNLLEERQAKRLFMFHAYGVEKKMKPNFNVIIDEIVKACGGLPLSIEVMGRFLSTKHCLQIWKEALWKLSAAEALGGGRENEVLWSKLKISYEDLEEEEKNMFLDIACFFDGYETNTTFRIGTYRCPILGLRNLKDRSLIKITKDGYLNMHEQLKDMGQQIAMEQRSRIFIWNPKKPNIFLANKKVCYMLKFFNQFDLILKLLTHLLVFGLKI
jgi:adenylate kinase family enzyme